MEAVDWAVVADVEVDPVDVDPVPCVVPAVVETVADEVE